MVLPHTDAVGALQVSEEICDQVTALKFTHTGSKCSQWITLSLGVATLVPTQQLLTATLIALADEALYQAKAAGRNRIVLQQQPDFLNAQGNSGNCLSV